MGRLYEARVESYITPICEVKLLCCFGAACFYTEKQNVQNKS